MLDLPSAPSSKNAATTVEKWFQPVANTVEMAASRFNMLQIARQLMRHCGGEKNIPAKEKTISWRKPGPTLSPY